MELTPIERGLTKNLAAAQRKMQMRVERCTTMNLRYLSLFEKGICPNWSLLKRKQQKSREKNQRVNPETEVKRRVEDESERKIGERENSEPKRKEKNTE